MGLAVGDDALRHRRADVRQHLQFGGACCIDVHPCGGRHHSRSDLDCRLRCSRATGHEHMLVIRERRRQVDAVQVGVVSRTTHGFQRVDEQAARGQRHDAGLHHRAADVNAQRLRRRRGERHDRLGNRSRSAHLSPIRRWRDNVGGPRSLPRRRHAYRHHDK